MVDINNNLIAESVLMEKKWGKPVFLKVSMILL